MSVSSLVSRLRPRLGRFVPREFHPEWIERDQWSFAHRGMRAKVVDRDDPRARSQVKDYMRSVFYREAPIPRVFGLAAEGASREVLDFVEEEMDVHLDYGITLMFTRCQDDDHFAGMSTFATWGRNDNYEVIGGDCTAWLNAAAVLAEERASEVDPRITWRDLQFQHIYDLCQKTLEGHPDKKGMIWATHLSFTEESRDLGLSEATISNCVRVTSNSGLLLGTQISFPGFAPFLLRNFDGPRLLAESRYADQLLEVNGKKVLQSLSKLGAMQYYVNEPLDGDDGM